MSNAEIIGSTTVLVNAGGEATAACMGGAVYYMLMNRHIYDTAKKEVRDAFPNHEAITSTTSHQLTYLEAIVKEVTRIHAPAPGNFARRTNASTLIDGHVVPANVSSARREVIHWLLMTSADLSRSAPIRSRSLL
jgi:cytochrome P450